MGTMTIDAAEDNDQAWYSVSSRSRVIDAWLAAGRARGLFSRSAFLGSAPSIEDGILLRHYCDAARDRDLDVRDVISWGGENQAAKYVAYATRWNGSTEPEEFFNLDSAARALLKWASLNKETTIWRAAAAEACGHPRPFRRPDDDSGLALLGNVII